MKQLTTNNLRSILSYVTQWPPAKHMPLFPSIYFHGSQPNEDKKKMVFKPTLWNYLFYPKLTANILFYQHLFKEMNKYFGYLNAFEYANKKKKWKKKQTETVAHNKNISSKMKRCGKAAEEGFYNHFSFHKIEMKKKKNT